MRREAQGAAAEQPSGSPPPRAAAKRTATAAERALLVTAERARSANTRIETRLEARTESSPETQAEIEAPAEPPPVPAEPAAAALAAASIALLEARSAYLEGRVAALEAALERRYAELSLIQRQVCQRDLILIARLLAGLPVLPRGAFEPAFWQETTALSAADVDATLEDLWDSLTPPSPDLDTEGEAEPER